MTGLSSLFSSYSICFGHDKLQVADETLSSIFGKGSINVSPIMSLSSFLRVPKFTTNLLFISRITRDLNYPITFFPSHCVFQDLDSKQMIGSGRAADGIYLLDAEVDTPSSFACHSSSCSNNMSNKDWLLQWHNRLGHLSVSSIKLLFPSLFFVW